ncbi:hypothetical protein EDB81DRAFT_119840 [Dactylonectria macrodidyma]|uniref:Uncharacterized protein n=1 Tax=Dactylonectria macrodidyma TaxID=307937 RepID=A0A9P9E6L9_9HYPO|nr:hypothetical protein EDB81DRAFT_119840 [Dactylonectria macrodidyma]
MMGHRFIDSCVHTFPILRQVNILYWNKQLASSFSRLHSRSLIGWSMIVIDSALCCFAVWTSHGISHWETRLRVSPMTELRAPEAACAPSKPTATDALSIVVVAFTDVVVEAMPSYSSTSGPIVGEEIPKKMINLHGARIMLCDGKQNKGGEEASIAVFRAGRTKSADTSVAMLREFHSSWSLLDGIVIEANGTGVSGRRQEQHHHLA